MAFRVRKAAVLGSGVMGSGIAAQLANAGIPVLMLDMVPPKAEPGEDASSKAFRNKFAAAALARMAKHKPAPLMVPRAAELITVGNFDDDLARIAQCDWVVEVIREDLALKRALFERVEAVASPGSVLSSNTSGLRIAEMVRGRSEAFQKRFLVTHFFNPVRYMKLLEVVAGEKTDPAVVTAFAAWAGRALGKGIVYGKDTPNFIGNRVGVYASMRTIQLMGEYDMSIEEVDSTLGAPLGRPASAVFRTADLVGLDTMLDVSQHCFRALESDSARDVFALPAWLVTMVEEKKLLGDKSGSGFYKKVKGATGTEVQVLDIATFEYRAKKKVRFESLGAARDIDDVTERVKAVLTGTDKAAKFAEHITLDVMAYAAKLVGEIADDYVNIDRAMEWGYGWKLGPFATWDAIGVEYGVARMAALGISVPEWVKVMLAKGRTKFYLPDGAADTYWDAGKTSAVRVPTVARRVSLTALRRTSKPLHSSDSASIWNMGDGVLLVEFHSKMNAINTDSVAALHHAVDLSETGDWRAIVVGNDGEHFSAGANIGMLLWACKEGQWKEIRQLVSEFQNANQRLRYCNAPVVTAPFGFTFGGGCELAMAGNAQQAAAETYDGLVEVGVGLIPGGGGTMEHLRTLLGAHAGSRDFDAWPFIRRAFLDIATARVSTSGEEARDIGYLTLDAFVSMNRDDLLADAKARAIGMAEAGFVPPRPTIFFLPGRSGAATADMQLYDMLQNHQISEYDRHIGQKLASVLTGGDCTPEQPLSEQYLLDLEAEAFLSLCGEAKTQDRLQHMLEKGKPLRN